MNTWDVCKNCGGEYGLHHYQTNQCPVGGREAAIGQKQEWKSTTFELDDAEIINEISTLQADNRKLANALSKITYAATLIQDGRRDGAAFGNLSSATDEASALLIKIGWWK